MFSVVGTQDYTKVYSQSGEIFKKLGVTNLASIGYPIPSSEDTAKATAISAQMAGVKVGYLNTSLPLGSTNVGPIVLAMKDAGANGLNPDIISNSAFAIVEGLKQQGIPLKAAVLAQGYGGDLAQGVQVPYSRLRESISAWATSRWKCTPPPPRSCRTP